MFVNRDPRTCGRKKRYRSFNKARRAARVIYHDTGQHTHAFVCTLCRGVHVGAILDDVPNLRVPIDEPSIRKQLDDYGLDVMPVYGVKD